MKIQYWAKETLVYRAQKEVFLLEQWVNLCIFCISACISVHLLTLRRTAVGYTTCRIIIVSRLIYVGIFISSLAFLICIGPFQNATAYKINLFWIYRWLRRSGGRSPGRGSHSHHLNVRDCVWTDRTNHAHTTSHGELWILSNLTRP